MISHMPCKSKSLILTLLGTTILVGQSKTPPSATWGQINGDIQNQSDLQQQFSTKQATLAKGTTAQYLRGDHTLAAFPAIPSTYQNIVAMWTAGGACNGLLKSDGTCVRLEESPATPLVTIIGTDKSTCTISKRAGDSIDAPYSCTTADHSHSVNATLVGHSGAPAAHASTFGITGTVVCNVGVNPTAAAHVIGSIGSVPANGIAWDCSGDGSTAVKGSAVWP